MDWVLPGSDGRPALANFLFEGGQLTQDQAEARLRLDTHELSEWRLTTVQEWDYLLLPHMARRLRACADALATGTTAYLQHGWHPTHPDDWRRQPPSCRPGNADTTGSRHER